MDVLFWLIHKTSRVSHTVDYVLFSACQECSSFRNVCTLLWSMYSNYNRIALRGHPKLSTLPRAYTEYYFVWPPFLIMFISKLRLKIAIYIGECVCVCLSVCLCVYPSDGIHVVACGPIGTKFCTHMQIHLQMVVSKIKISPVLSKGGFGGVLGGQKFTNLE